MRFLKRIKTDQELEDEADRLAYAIKAKPKSAAEWGVLVAAAQNLTHHLDIRNKVLQKLGSNAVRDGSTISG